MNLVGYFLFKIKRGRVIRLKVFCCNPPFHTPTPLLHLTPCTQGQLERVVLLSRPEDHGVRSNWSLCEKKIVLRVSSMHGKIMAMQWDFLIVFALLKLKWLDVKLNLKE